MTASLYNILSLTAFCALCEVQLNMVSSVSKATAWIQRVVLTVRKTAAKQAKLALRGGKAVGFLGFATSQMMMSPSAPPEASKLGLSWLNARPLTCNTIVIHQQLTCPCELHCTDNVGLMKIRHCCPDWCR